MSKGRELPRYVRRDRVGTLYFVKRFGGKDVWKKLVCQVPKGERVPASLHVEVESYLNGTTPLVTGKTIADVIDNYERHDKYKRLKIRTRDDYDKRLNFHREKRGHLEPRNIERRHIIAWRDAWAKESPHEANYRLRILKIIMQHALDLGLFPKEVTVSPAVGIEEVRYKKKQREPWPDEKIADMRSHATGRTLLLFELLIDTGQRISDVLKMKWGDVADGGIWVTQNKTGAEHWVPFADRTINLLATEKKRSVFILTNEQATGPWSYRGASQALRNAREAIGAESYDAHSLRHTKASQLAEEGHDDETIAAITGHGSLAMVKLYTSKTRQIARAKKTKK